MNSSTGLTEAVSVRYSNVAAHIKWRTGNERIQSDKVTYYRDATLRCRVPGAITTKDRIRYNDQDFEIVNVVDVNNLGRLVSIDIKRIE